MGVAALLGLLALLASPGTPWSIAPLLVVVAVVSPWQPRLLRLGVVALWCAAIPEAPWPFLAAALVLGALRWNRVATGLVALGLLIAARQWVASRELPEAVEVVPRMLVSLVLAACAWAAATPGPGRLVRLPDHPRGGSVLVGLAGAVLLARLVGVERAEDPLVSARSLHATRLLYPSLLADPDRRLALVAAVPDRDEAAVAWLADAPGRSPEVPLAVGWRPQRPALDPVDLARRLEARGRGGEALRLLRRYPREGAVDWWRGLLERTQGETVRWRGGVDPAVAHLPGRVALDLRWDTNQYLALPFQLEAEVDTLILTGGGTAWRGPPTVEVKLDAGPVRAWPLDGPGRLELPGPHAAGPHRLEVRFDTDRVGPDGDRNVWLDALFTSP